MTIADPDARSRPSALGRIADIQAMESNDGFVAVKDMIPSVLEPSLKLAANVEHDDDVGPRQVAV